jgi:hypothetical protein
MEVTIFDTTDRLGVNPKRPEGPRIAPHDFTVLPTNWQSEVRDMKHWETNREKGPISFFANLLSIRRKT